MKKKLLLEAVLKLRADVERAIESTYDDVIKYNFTSKKVDALLLRLEKLEIQLIHLKEVIQEANKGKMQGVTNNYNIYYLSNVQTKKKFYETLSSKFYNKEGNEVKNFHKAQITFNETQSAITRLGEEVNKFQKKLSAFNAKKKVTVYLDESLNLL